MELGTQAVDRLLGVLAPALEAELERVLAEARREQDAEFQMRLESVIRDVKAESRRAADIEIAQAVSEASGQAAASAAATTRREVTTQLQAASQAAIVAAIHEATAKLQAEFRAQQQQAEGRWAGERLRLDHEMTTWRFLAEAESQLAGSGSQTEMLVRFLKLAATAAPSVALYVVKHDGLALWKSRGAAVFPPIVSRETSDPEMYFRPVVVLGKPVAAIAAAPPFRRESMDFLAACLDRSIALIGFKLKRPIPAASAPATATEASAAKPAAAPVDETLHAEARQAARLLISEIKLYCEQEVREGRAHRDLYRRLRDEIENGRQEYLARVSSVVAEARDYFHEELVRALAEDNPECLGADYPGAMV